MIEETVFYLLYRLGIFFALAMPLKVSYKAACLMADIYYSLSYNDRIAVIKNINMALGKTAEDEESRKIARAVFRNFAKYLVDFFRFSMIDEDYIKKYIKVEGLANVDEGLSRGKGVVLLSAHMGNWELGASILSLIGYPTAAVVLSHRHKKINDFFLEQRRMCKVQPIEIGMSLKACYKLLKGNGLLALLGDRDFTKNGLESEFFGQKALIPKGPSIFSYRIGSAIVPSFMIRQPDDTFKLTFERPIYPDTSSEEGPAVAALTGKCTSVIESYIKRYPSQWYAFKYIWDKNELLRPDTIL
ncbi:MAG: lysophospholipid acyltransferase family protein [Candidatus Omnitrophica bacterium]|nr:lysophospholipid acyltransferase family protein [Candidatus Omnitrophota bacterium]